MNPALSMLRDSSVLLVAMAVVAQLAGGVAWTLGVLAGGALILTNAWLIARLVARMAADEASGVELAFGLVGKTVLSLVALYFMLGHLHVPAVLVGLVTVVCALGLRTFLRAFAAPELPREA